MLAQLTALTALEMPWCVKVTNGGLAAITPLTRLATLNISGCQLISEAGIACMAALTNLEVRAGCVVWPAAAGMWGVPRLLQCMHGTITHAHVHKHTYMFMHT